MDFNIFDDKNMFKDKDNFFDDESNSDNNHSEKNNYSDEEDKKNIKYYSNEKNKKDININSSKERGKIENDNDKYITPFCGKENNNNNSNNENDFLNITGTNINKIYIPIDEYADLDFYKDNNKNKHTKIKNKEQQKNINEKFLEKKRKK